MSCNFRNVLLIEICIRMYICTGNTVFNTTRFFYSVLISRNLFIYFFFSLSHICIRFYFGSSSFWSRRYIVDLLLIRSCLHLYHLFVCAFLWSSNCIQIPYGMNREQRDVKKKFNDLSICVTTAKQTYF